MYTSHPLYFVIFAKLLSEERFRDLNIKAHLGLFYLDQRFCAGESEPEYEGMLKRVSLLLSEYDTGEAVKIYSDSEA